MSHCNHLAFVEEFTIRIIVVSIGIIKVIALLLKTVLALDKVERICGFVSQFATNGCLKSSVAVGRSFGFFSRHFVRKS